MPFTSSDLSSLQIVAWIGFVALAAALVGLSYLIADAFGRWRKTRRRDHRTLRDAIRSAAAEATPVPPPASHPPEPPDSSPTLFRTAVAHDAVLARGFGDDRHC